MGALVAGTTHAPITAILMIFEMTNDYRIIPPLMLACVLAIVVSTFLCRNSIYTEKLARRGIHLFEGRDVNLLRTIHVEEVMDPDAPVVSAGLPFSELIPNLLSNPHTELLVVDADERYIGEVEVPSAMTGKTLAEVGLRRRFNVEVVLIQTGDTDESTIDDRPGKVPAADTKLSPGDRLLVLGSIESIEGLREGAPVVVMIEAFERRSGS